MKSVAIVILNFNTQKFLEDFLPSVVETDYENLQIVLIDNASTDNSVEFIKSNYPQIQLIVNDKNYGFTGGYNEGLKQIKADYFVLLNSDVKVSKNWIKTMVKLCDENPQIKAVQPKILAYHNPKSFEYAGAAGGFIDMYGYPFCKGRIFEELETDEGQYNKAEPIFWATGAAMFIDSNIYNQLGGLDNDFFAHMEEIDLCWRIHNAGYEVWSCPQSEVWHVGGGTLNKTNPKKTFLNFRNGLFLLIKNEKFSTLFFKLILRIMLDYVAALKFLLNKEFDFAKAIVKAHFETLKMSKKMFGKRTNSKVKTHKTIYHNSIVFDYFIRKKKKFSELEF